MDRSPNREAARKEKLPNITHLQFAVLDLLVFEEVAGRVVRNKLAAKTSLPAFYQMMRRLEDVGLIEGRYQRTDAPKVSFRERFYSLTEPGRRARASVIAFYADRAASGSPTVTVQGVSNEGTEKPKSKRDRRKVTSL
ncbi:hypothetical protein [Planctomicrobium piriforme]|uniref:hypothetical protein n=1 Tax=Planctomicrobium piriforme TaxID=1576369 RepID=UPI001113CF3B|nr:hypothetical protein [Planctomicrobium piriforme]